MSKFHTIGLMTSFLLWNSQRLKAKLSLQKDKRKPGQEPRDTVVPISRETIPGPVVSSGPQPLIANPSVSEGQDLKLLYRLQYLR